MIYIVDDRPTLYFEGVEELATGTVEDSVWDVYCTDRSAWQIENGKFIALKPFEELRANTIRNRRERECFPIINRGSLWYNKLTEQQKAELSTWYEAWLDAPETGTAPTAPVWLNEVAGQAKTI